MSMAIVLQARMGSSRLPGKALAMAAGHSLLSHAVNRLKISGLRIVVATTVDERDDALETAAQALEVDVYRGQRDDVLGRVLDTARAFGLAEIVLANADHPAVDIEGVLRIAELRRRVHADHAVECGLPQGAAVEVVTVDALRRAHELVVDPYDFEHVTSFIRRDARFTAMRAVAPGHLRRPGLRLAVETAEDLAFMGAVLSSTPTAAPLAPLDEIIGVAEAAVVRAERARLAARKGA